MTERQNEALLRLLADAGQGGQAKVDALVALSQRTLWVVPWEGVEGYRTLVNSSGLAALPVFTSEAELQEAALRFGWLSPTGTVPHAEIGARAAFGHAQEKKLAFVVVDITSDHSLEISEDELAPLLTRSRSPSAGPFAAAGRVESSLMAAVRKSEPGMAAVRPGTPPSGAARPATPASGLQAVRAPTPTPGGVPALVNAPTSLPAGALPPRPETEKGPEKGKGPAQPPVAAQPLVAAQILSSTRIFPPATTPDDALLDCLETILRGYPEVEWGCIGSASAQPALALRIDPRMRKRLEPLAEEVAKASGLVVVTLDDPAHFKAAKGEAFVFFPWRR
ncbi:MAG: SseB family protein [Deltaproteobacteria bacterium]|jgi:hypothetical protein